MRDLLTAKPVRGAVRRKSLKELKKVVDSFKKHCRMRDLFW